MGRRAQPAGDDRERPHDDPRPRALLLWPGLDGPKLARTRGEPGRVARLVGRRTALPHETILRMLGCDPEACRRERHARSATEPGTPRPGHAAVAPLTRAAGRAPRSSQPLIRAVTGASQLGGAS